MFQIEIIAERADDHSTIVKKALRQFIGAGIISHSIDSMDRYARSSLLAILNGSCDGME
jgi:hypothetical protein